MKPENKRMKEFLATHGIVCVPKYITTGSLRGTWSLYGKDQAWSDDLAETLSALGFTDFDGHELGHYSGNGGQFSVVVRGHSELL